SSFELTVYSDADWTSCTDSRHSLTGYCIFFGAALFLGRPRNNLLFPVPLRGGI
ncbi:UNVERIFIED_CONTAM: hypothetical protein Sindi_1851800, partial [Sesamum indicum]